MAVAAADLAAEEEEALVVEEEAVALVAVEVAEAEAVVVAEAAALSVDETLTKAHQNMCRSLASLRTRVRISW